MLEDKRRLLKTPMLVHPEAKGRSLIDQLLFDHKTNAAPRLAARITKKCKHLHSAGNRMHTASEVIKHRKRVDREKFVLVHMLCACPREDFRDTS